MLSRWESGWASDAESCTLSDSRKEIRFPFDSALQEGERAWLVQLGAGMFPYSVSGNGKIAGDYIDRQGIDHGFIWKQD